MAVGLFKYNGDINDRNSEVVLSENISSQEFYDKYWERAIFELKIKFLQDGAEIKKSNLEQVLIELNLLKEWANKNLSNSDLEYMTTRIENLEKVIPNALNNEDSLLYIY